MAGDWVVRCKNGPPFMWAMSNEDFEKEFEFCSYDE